MTNLKLLICLIVGHDWRNDHCALPVHGYDDIPYKDSYCARCGSKAS